MTAKTGIAVQRKLFNVEDYYTMLDTGILTEDDRVELIHGEIIKMTPIGSRHSGYVTILTNYIKEELGKLILVSVQNPVSLSKYSEPEPDIAVLKPRDDFYTDSHPIPSEIFFLIEVADTSVGYDYDIKLPMYAAAGILEVWVLDINEAQLTQHTQPDGNEYLEQKVLRVNDKLKCEILDLELDMKQILIKEK
ncbi:MAG: Uma2 family endonuclease [Bacteroidota bacterium]